MGGIAATAPPTAEQLSIQARADQIMAGIVEAHETLNGILGQEPEQDVSASAGAEQQLDRCREGLAALNSRLRNLSDRTGKL